MTKSNLPQDYSFSLIVSVVIFVHAVLIFFAIFTEDSIKPQQIVPQKFTVQTISLSQPKELKTQEIAEDSPKKEIVKDEVEKKIAM